MREFWRMMLKYVGPYRKFLAGSVVLNMLSAIFNIFSFTMIIPMLRILFRMDTSVHEFVAWDADMGLKDKLLNNIYYYVGYFNDLWGGSKVLLLLCIGLVFMTVLKTLCYFGSTAVMIPIRTGIVRDIRMEIYDKILSLPIGFFSQEKKGDIVARMSGDVQEVETSITSSIDILIKDPILILFYFAVLLFSSWQLTLFTILFVPLMTWIMGVIGKQLKKKSLQAQALWSDTMAQVDETLGGLRVVKAFNAERKMSARFWDVIGRMRRKYNKVNTRQALAHPVSEFLGTVMIAIVLWFGGTLMLAEKSAFDAPTFMFFMVMLYSIINPLKELSKATYAIPKGLASMERINKILDAESDIREVAQPKALDGFRDSIELRDVDFYYEDGSRKILDGVNLTIGKGKYIAIVGASGAGKSTLVDMIPRFYDPAAGSILIDGVDIRECRISDLRALMGFVNQDPILFNDTIFNNIAFGVEGATMQQVVEAAKIANAHDFIMEKEEGYDFVIGDRGVRLSGGQRQRLSIARAVLKNPPILILDEATASLDTESERAVQEALDRLMAGHTTIAIAHRLSTVKDSDEIIVMDGGRIVERGTHTELLAKAGIYRKLTEMQTL